MLRIRCTAIVGFGLLLLTTAVLAQDANPSLETKLNEALTSLYCYCGCTRETIQHCVCGTAQQLEADFNRRLVAGETVAQIRADYLATFGTQYSALMPAKGFNLVAYTMPGVIILLLGVVVFLVIKSKRAPQKQSVQAAHQPDGDLYKDIEEAIERQKRER